MRPLACGIPSSPQGPLAEAENGEKLFARRRHRRHAHQPTEHSGHEPAPPLFQSHPLVLSNSWLSSRPHASIAWVAGMYSAHGLA